MALFPQGLRCWGLQQYILVTESAKQQVFGFSLNQYSVRQVTAILKNLESAPVWQNWWSVGKTITVAARLGFSWKRQQPALPNQWELGSPLAQKVPVQLRCLLFGIQAWSSTHNKWHMCDRIPTLCLETALAFQPVTQYLRRVSRRRWTMCLVHRGHKP